MGKAILIKLCLVGSLAWGGVALGQGDGSDGNRRPPRPPKEAVEACADRASGDACSFESPHGTVQGTCWAPREDLPLACRPADAPR